MCPAAAASPFVLSCVVSAMAGGVLGAFHVMQYSIGALGIFSWTAFVDTATNNTSGMVVAMVVAIVVSLVAMVADFILTLITYRDEPAQKS